MKRRDPLSLLYRIRRHSLNVLLNNHIHGDMESGSSFSCIVFHSSSHMPKYFGCRNLKDTYVTRGVPYFGSGSPFDPVKYNNEKLFVPAQV
jgi:hypothetical protein